LGSLLCLRRHRPLPLAGEGAVSTRSERDKAIEKAARALLDAWSNLGHSSECECDACEARGWLIAKMVRKRRAPRPGKGEP